MSKQITEEKIDLEKEKKWTNIDYSNTTAYRTVRAFNKEGMYSDEMMGPAKIGLVPMEEFQQLKKLRRIDATVTKQSARKRIDRMIRQSVQEFDSFGKNISKEYLTLEGYFTGEDHTGMEIATYFKEGVYKEPKMSKQYEFHRRFDPETGEDLGKIRLNGSRDVYYLAVPQDKKERIKFINFIIDNAKGLHKENIHFYFKDTERGLRDSTYSYQQFCDSSIDELKTLSKRGSGEKGGNAGYWRDPRGELRDRDGNLVKEGVYQ
ncbi:MAG TPA: hypothetical protein VE548_15895 [Nitrososphaeraceae archaeon]|nr:hypothetical protein [Nitrososphaeraceae archaeon]